MKTEEDRTLRVAAVPLTVQDGDPGANLARVQDELARAPEVADLVVLPELWNAGFQQSTWQRAAAASPPLIRSVEESCGKAGVAAAGSVVVEGSRAGKFRNRMLFVGADGKLADWYDKAHPFPPFSEHKYMEPGEATTIVPYGGFRIGLAICYDLRFPEMFRNMRIAGADIFLVSAAWPAARAEALEILCRARALENSCYLVLSNRTGTGWEGTVFGGEAMVVGPDGAVLARNEEDGANQGSAQAVLDRLELERTRSFLRVIEDRRPGVDTVGP